MMCVAAFVQMASRQTMFLRPSVQLRMSSGGHHARGDHLLLDRAVGFRDLEELQ